MSEKDIINENVKLNDIPSEFVDVKLDSPKDSYGIAAILSETLEAAVFADCSAAMKACQMIEQYAYGGDVYYSDGDWLDIANQNTPSMSTGRNVKSHELEMVNVDIPDGNGGTKTISLPKITMMPLPMLHITEANFDMDFSLELVQSADNDSVNMKESQSLNELPYGMISSASLLGRSSGYYPSSFPNASTNRSRPLNRYAVKDQRNLRTVYDSSVSDFVKTKMKVTDSSSSDSTSRIHMKIGVKMKQADLPEGLKAILQTAFNSMSITNVGSKYE